MSPVVVTLTVSTPQLTCGQSEHGPVRHLIEDGPLRCLVDQEPAHRADRIRDLDEFSNARQDWVRLCAQVAVGPTVYTSRQQFGYARLGITEFLKFGPNLESRARVLSRCLAH